MLCNLITYPEFFSGEAEALNGLLERFDFTLHIRKPKADTFFYEKLLSQVQSVYYDRIIIHQSESICKKLDLKGVHYPASKRPAIINSYSGTSCHSIKELEMLDGRYDYLYISPVFPSISKNGYSGDLDFEKLGCFLKNPHKSKVFALGGIDSARLQQLENFGFDGVAVLGAVWSDLSIKEKSFNELFKKITTCLRTDPIV